ncbi:MAG: ATP-dependent Clp protease adaptor ClpS [Myxococcota bacterium]|nr:ATP-dependent Clp protease adaptor ClpS [Myxococcota bacterium]MEE2779295.1 ATP-dependent Clp protease adaptor ClpS [Myxococcota bacterium]
MGDEKRPQRNDPGDEGQTVLDRKVEHKRPTMYRVLLHNDDYTTMEFVIHVLQEVFRKSETEATHLMLTIHHKGLGVAGVFTRDIAETKADRVARMAEEYQMPLLCTTEPDE